MGEAEAIVREEIVRNGAISVARFMELALYHPSCGYYRRRRDPFGSAGDFYTAEQLQPVFGELIASYVATVQKSTACGEAFSILELGAGRADMRSALSGWSYRGFDWIGDSLPPTMCGLILSNEFFDALPVHLLLNADGTWQELGVCVRNDKLSLTVMAPAASAIADYARRFGSNIPQSGLLEVHLDAALWFGKLSRIQTAGRLLVIDYGYSEHELARLAGGTLMTYRRHHASANFLSDPGERDITAHVNFSYFKELSIQHGYVVESDGSLSAWMNEVWNGKELSTRWRKNGERWKLQWKQLFFGMGQTFRVLELRKVVQKEKAPGV